MPYSRDERADLIFVPAARGPARGNTLNAREPDARKIFFLPVPEARGLFKARARCPKNKKIFL